MTLRILVTGDIHIGRSSTRLPSSIDSARLRAVNGWRAVVEHASTCGYDLVIITGDVADGDAFFEVIGPLEEGVRRLAACGTRTLAVAGNHDCNVLPRLAESLRADLVDESPAFRLLGEGGEWERETITKDGRDVLHVDGWSFPQREVRDDPLASYWEHDADGVPVLGVVHGDLDSPGSRYAPLSTAALRARPVDGWLLGHIHAPRLLADERPFILYPGSPQALDFGEPGLHGVWTIEVDRARVGTPQPVPLSFCRYELVDVDVTGVSEDALRAALLGAVRDEETRCIDEADGALEALALRARIAGRSPHAESIAALARELEEYEGSAARVVIDAVDCDVRPELDLDTVAPGTPLFVVAQLLRGLETADDAEKGDLLDEARDRIEEIRSRSEYFALSRDGAPSDAELGEVVQRELAVVFAALLAQQEGGS